jgi:hypothetical protein
MSCKILWSTTSLNRRFNHCYPFLLSTPNGQTIKKIDIFNMEKDEYTGQLVKIDTDRRDQPTLIVYRHNEYMNMKRYPLKQREAMFYVPIAGDLDGGRSTVMMSPTNVPESITMRRLILFLDSNNPNRHFSSFVLITARVQKPTVKYLYEARIEITMSDDTLITQSLKYISPVKRIQDEQNLAICRALYIFYHNINNIELTDSEIIDNITTEIPKFWPNLDQTIKDSKRKTASNGTKRRIVLNEKRKQKKMSLKEYNEGGVLCTPPYKRHISQTDAIIMSSIDWVDAESGIFYVIVNNVIIDGDEWVFDNVGSFPTIDGKVQILKEPPVELMDNPDMYKNISYRTIVENAREYAKVKGNTILWLKISDSANFNGPTHPTIIKFTARETTGGGYINIVTNSFKGYFLGLFHTKMIVIKSLYEYYNDIVSLIDMIDPQTTDVGGNDFTHFQKPDNIAWDDHSFDVDYFNMLNEPPPPTP